MTKLVCPGPGGRGCPCAWHERQRGYNLRHVRRKSAAALAAKQRSARVCPRRFGKHGVCGAVLESVIVDGRLLVVCPACERMARGICRLCPRPVAGKARMARWCADHKLAAERDASRRYRMEHRRELTERAKRAYREDGRVRQERIARNKAWRMRHPEGVKAQKRRHALKQSERDRAYNQAYKAKRRDELNALARARYHGVAPLRTCLMPGCDIVVTGRKKKCSRCKQRDAVFSTAVAA